MVCLTMLHGGVCHRTSTPHKSGNKMKEKKIQHFKRTSQSTCLYLQAAEMPDSRDIAKNRYFKKNYLYTPQQIILSNINTFLTKKYRRKTRCCQTNWKKDHLSR